MKVHIFHVFFCYEMSSNELQVASIELKYGAQSCFNNFEFRLFRSKFFVEAISILLLAFTLSHIAQTCCKNIPRYLSHAPKMTRDKHGLGLKSCRIVIFC